MFPEVSAEDCTNSKENPCPYDSECYYLKAKREAISAPLAVLNIAYFLSEANYIGTFTDIEYLTIDECDVMEDQLMNFIEVVITSKQLSELDIQPPKFKTKFESWVEWANEALNVLNPRLEHIQKEIEGNWSTVNFNLMKEEKRLSKLISKLSFFVREVDTSWVWVPSEDRWVFKPIKVSKYCEHYLWRHAKRVLGMSATILDPIQMCVNIGLKPTNYTYKALPSSFPIEIRPVIYEPCANVTNKTMDVALPALKERIEQIMIDHPDEKILCHVVSYKIRDYLIKNIQSIRLVTHNSYNRAEILDNFKKSRMPKVLISPSMDRGVDLPGDECRVVIIAKMPFGDLGDPQVSKRVYGYKDGNRWYAHKTISKIVQMAGRGVRSKDDYAITYILDSQFERIYNDNKFMFPGWFRESVIIK